MSLLVVPLAGCGAITGGSYCDVSKPLLFDNETTVDWLLDNDRNLLQNIIVHNETNARICD